MKKKKGSHLSAPGSKHLKVPPMLPAWKLEQLKAEAKAKLMKTAPRKK